MENSKALYVEIADRLCDKIISGEIGGGASKVFDEINYATEFKISKNITILSLEYLVEMGILKKIDKEYFLNSNATQTALEYRRGKVLKNEMNYIFELLSGLKITEKELTEAYTRYLKLK